MKKRWWVLAALLAVLGGLACFAYTPVRFSGYLLLCAAAFCLLWGWLEARRGRPARMARRLLALLLSIGLTVFAILEIKIVSYGCTDEDRSAVAVVVLGAGVNGTRPSLSLQTRLQATLDYIADKPDIPVLVTGSQGPGEEISEAQCMADWLAAHGVAPERILLEEQADNTEENILYAKETLLKNEVDVAANIAVVTSDYHLYRASLYWDVPGMVPVAAHMPEPYWPMTVNYYIREAFAVAKLLIFD